MAARRASTPSVPPTQSPAITKAATPIAIRLSAVSIRPDLRAYIRAKIASKLAKFATSIGRATVRLRDENGPRGGVDITCTIKVELRGVDTVVYEAAGEAPREAFDLAAGGIVRVITRALGKANHSAPKGRGRTKLSLAGGASARSAPTRDDDDDDGDDEPASDATPRRAPRAAGKSATQLARREVRATRSPKTRARNAVVKRTVKGGG